MCRAYEANKHGVLMIIACNQSAKRVNVELNACVLGVGLRSLMPVVLSMDDFPRVGSVHGSAVSGLTNKVQCLLADDCF